MDHEIAALKWDRDRHIAANVVLKAEVERKKERIAALEAEVAALKEAIEYQPSELTTAVEYAKWMAAKHRSMCTRLQETAQKHKLGTAGESVDKSVCEGFDRLEAENAALREQWDKAMCAAKEEAGHEIGLWPPGAVAAIYSLRDENAALRADKERLDKLWELCREHMYGPYGVGFFYDDEDGWFIATVNDGDNVITLSHGPSVDADIRSAIDAARKEEPHA